MAELEKTEKYDNAKISFIIDLDQLHPIGYIYKNGERYPILLGGKTYSVNGNIIIKNKSRTYLEIYKLKVSVEGKIISVLNKNTASEAIIEQASATHTISRSISKSLTIPFTIQSYTPKVDSYNGITTSVIHTFKATIATPGVDIYNITIPYFVRFPMPISPLSIGFTSTCNLMDIFVLRIHLDRSLYTVNDIITGWIEVLKSERRMDSVFLSLIREEKMTTQDENGETVDRISKDQLLKQEIVDMLMAVNNYEQEQRKKQSEDIIIKAEHGEEWIDTSVTHMPFRLFINEHMGICPGYSLINNQLSVNWALKFSVLDMNKMEYSYTVGIDIVRGDIFTCDSF